MKGAEVHATQIGIAIGGCGGIVVTRVRVGIQQLLLECSAGADGSAAHANHLVEPAMQVNHMAAAGAGQHRPWGVLAQHGAERWRIGCGRAGDGQRNGLRVGHA